MCSYHTCTRSNHSCGYFGGLFFPVPLIDIVGGIRNNLCLDLENLCHSHPVAKPQLLHYLLNILIYLGIRQKWYNFFLCKSCVEYALPSFLFNTNLKQKHNPPPPSPQSLSVTYAGGMVCIQAGWYIEYHVFAMYLFHLINQWCILYCG